jgi:hypothetical protein
MSYFSLIAALSVLCVNAQSEGTGTNGAGEARNWTPVSGEWGGSAHGTFFSVGDGCASISFSQGLHWECPVSHKQVLKIDRTVKSLVRVPLATLSGSDRRWIEERNPLETCLSKTSIMGAVGTLAPRNGSYRVQKIEGDKALIEHVVGEKTVWTFWLRSRLVSSMQTSQTYEAISTTLVKDFEKLASRDKERYGIDFQVVANKPAKKGKCLTIIEDHR